MSDNFAENLAKLCQKADQPARVTAGAKHDEAIRRVLRAIASSIGSGQSVPPNGSPSVLRQMSARLSRALILINPMIRRLRRFSQMKSQGQEPEKNLCESV